LGGREKSSKTGPLITLGGPRSPSRSAGGPDAARASRKMFYAQQDPRPVAGAKCGNPPTTGAVRETELKADRMKIP